MRLVHWEDIPGRMQNESVKRYYELLSRKKASLFFKRIFDVAMGVILLAALSPLFLVLGIAIKVDSPGPALFRQERITQYGKGFIIYKFRTMAADGVKRFQMANENDSRVTKLGGKLRKSRLDEIPQLVNVIRGEMSFVGTRPEVPDFVEKYTDEMLATLLLPAGVTSLASIMYMEENKIMPKTGDTNLFYANVILPEKMVYNLQSIEEFSLLNEIGVLAGTVIKVSGSKKQTEFDRKAISMQDKV
jgi:Sugar transferases involved in lipopolysaccharide synthesis